MTEKESAYPIPWYYKSFGLSKRQLYAAMAMQGLLASSSNGAKDASRLASKAVESADALIEALKKTQAK